MDRWIKILRLAGLGLMLVNEAVKLRNNVRAGVVPNPLLRLRDDTDAAHAFSATTSEDAFERAAERAARGGQV